MRSLSDTELVARAQSAMQGDTRAFGELVRRHERRVLVNCRVITRSPANAEDLAQDVMVKAYFAIKRFEGRSKFSTWINRIKVNHCLNFLQKRKGRDFVDADDVPLAGGEATDRNLDRTDMRTEIEATLDQMPDSLRVPLIMRDLDQLSYQDIADALSLKLSAVKMRIKRGRAMFRELYGDGPGR
ncbi:MAG: RNA polymerase sigma-70 factor (ECF subfamily) [Bradymonadia bacterium]